MTEFLKDCIEAYNYFVLTYFILLNSSYFLLMVIAGFHVNSHYRRQRFLDFKAVQRSNLTFPISIIAPAYNESASIVQSVKSLLMLNYPLLEVIVVNDGSSDETLRNLVEAYRLTEVPYSWSTEIPCNRIRGVYQSPLQPNLLVIDKENGGKSDAINAGINGARHPLVCVIDADSILEEDALLRLIHPFLERPAETVAAGGLIRIANGCNVVFGKVISTGVPKSILARFQILEYMRAFLFGRIGLSVLQSLIIVSGAFGVFRTDLVRELGGYRRGTVGEDIDIVVRLHRLMRDKNKPYRIFYVPDPVCWTEAPEKLSTLRNQRNRWQRGLIETLVFNREMLFRPRYGRIGMVAMPYYLFFEALGPVIEITGYVMVLLSWYLDIINLEFMVFFLMVCVLYGIFLSMGSLLLEEISYRRYTRLQQLFMLSAYALLENLGYRQLNSWWRLRAVFDVAWKKEKGWGVMERKGFQSGATVRKT